MMETATQRHCAVTDQELRRAEEGLVRLLHAKRFPREWIERHVPDVMAQARTDFAARLAAGREDDTVNLLVVIGYRRALKVLRSERTGPQTTSIETVFHLADESAPTPEQEAIDHDRQERVVWAMSHLPERERELLSLVYFENMSIRAAGRQLGWGKSAVDRHHQAALDRLHAMLDRSLLAPEIAIPAFVASRSHPLPRAALHWARGAAETIRDTAVMGGNRVGPLAETGNAAALSGAGRTAAGICGAAVVACLAGATTGVVGPGIRPGDVSQAHQGGEPADPRERPSVQGWAPTSDAANQDSEAEPERPRDPDGAHPISEQSRPSTQSAPPAATLKETVNEFGLESGEVEESPPAAADEEATQATPITKEPAPAARPSAESSEQSSSDAPSAPEFGM